jgi:hypothetical protein
MMERTSGDMAKATLLRALQSIEDSERELGPETQVRHLAVVFSVVGPGPEGAIEEHIGWESTEDPEWLTAALLRRAAAIMDAACGEDENAG